MKGATQRDGGVLNDKTCSVDPHQICKLCENRKPLCACKALSVPLKYRLFRHLEINEAIEALNAADEST